MRSGNMDFGYSDQEGSRMWRGLWILAGAAAGGIAAYYFDPRQGRRRREQFVDRAQDVKERLSDYVGEATEGIREQASDMVSSATDAIQNMRGNGDLGSDLIQKVKDQVAQKFRGMGPVDVQMEGSNMVLKGLVDEDQIEDILKFVRKIPGVGSVVNKFEKAARSGSSSGEQKGSSREHKGREGKTIPANANNLNEDKKAHLQ